MSAKDITPIIRALCRHLTVIDVKYKLLEDAIRIMQTYSFSFYDSLIVSAALYSNCATLYIEDLQNNQVIDKSLTVINPFKDF